MGHSLPPPPASVCSRFRRTVPTDLGAPPSGEITSSYLPLAAARILIARVATPEPSVLERCPPSFTTGELAVLKDTASSARACAVGSQAAEMTAMHQTLPKLSVLL